MYEIPMGELLLLISLMVVAAFVYTATRNRASGLGRQPAH
jgi:predicted small secreted protein